MNTMYLLPTTRIHLSIPSNLTDEQALALRWRVVATTSPFVQHIVETDERALAMQGRRFYTYPPPEVNTYDWALAGQTRGGQLFYQPNLPEVETYVSFLDDLNEVNRTDDQTGDLGNTAPNNTKVVINQNSVVNVDFFGWSAAKQQLEEIREKVEKAQALDSEIDPVPESAYENAAQVLDKILVWGVSIPDIGWLIDGGIGFEWWSKDSKGIGTISIYGDNLVVYGTSGEVSGEPIKIKGTCPLSNLASLNDFRTKLLILCSQ